jgi:hypothetical protein
MLSSDMSPESRVRQRIDHLADARGESPKPL